MTPETEKAFLTWFQTREGHEFCKDDPSDVEKYHVFAAGEEFGRKRKKSQCLEMLKRRVCGAHADYMIWRGKNEDAAREHYRVWEAFSQFLHAFADMDRKMFGQPWPGEKETP